MASHLTPQFLSRRMTASRREIDTVPFPSRTSYDRRRSISPAEGGSGSSSSPASNISTFASIIESRFRPFDDPPSPPQNSRMPTPFPDAPIHSKLEYAPIGDAGEHLLDPNIGGSKASSSLVCSDGFNSEKPYNQDKLEPSVKSDYGDEGGTKNKARTRWLLFVFGLVLVILAVVLAVYFAVIRQRGNKNSGSAASVQHSATPSATSSAPATQPTVLYGGDGTIVTTEQGTSFTYSNKFGGYFVQDPSNPFNNDARAQSWSPPLNQTWEWGKDQVFGVNLGGWLVLEPFITPALYQKYPGTVDEWTLSVAMAADQASGGLNQLEEHYKTFITEEDFAQIAGAGLNWVRIPIAFWAIDTWPGEPFLPKVSWTYALKAFEWARKYGLRVCLDLHAAPGSQNGYNHSGQVGKVNFLNGVMGIANAQRLLHYIRIITEFISQPQYKDVVLMFGIVNEPAGLPMEPLSHFYLEAYRMIRKITGVGAGNGPYISMHDSFNGGRWAGFLSGSDRLAIEPHPYFAFNNQGSTVLAPYIPQACQAWGPMMNSSQTAFGVTTAGEWSLAFNDCGLFLHSPLDEHTTTGCAVWDQWENYTAETKQQLMSFAMASMDALQHWFFWTWKVAPSATDNSPRAPFWSYKLGLDNGWIPLNPRDASGHCASVGVTPDTVFNGVYLPWQTGGPGAGNIVDTEIAKFGQWPPPNIGVVGAAALLPTYTATGTVPTLPPETFRTPFATGVDPGDGWYNDADTAKGMTTVAGCPYPNAWDATAAPVPAALCTGT